MSEHDSDAEILEIKEKQHKEEISRLQTMLEAAQHKISLLEEELQIRQKVTEELQLKGMVRTCMHA